MTELERRYMHARQRVESHLTNPTVELVAAAAQYVQQMKDERDAARDVLETMRPVWAQGWTDDGVAAQASAAALAQLWQMLDVSNQTEAAERLRQLLTVARSCPANIWTDITGDSWRPGDAS